MRKAKDEAVHAEEGYGRLRPYVSDDQLGVILTVQKAGSGFEVRIEAHVVGSDGLIDGRRATWMLGRVNRKKNGNLEILSTDRRIYWPGIFPVPRIGKDKEYGRKMRKFADWVSSMISPGRSLSGSELMRGICQQVYGQVDVHDVMGT